MSENLAAQRERLITGLVGLADGQRPETVRAMVAQLRAVLDAAKRRDAAEAERRQSLIPTT